jgi:hypothetical protein
MQVNKKESGIEDNEGLGREKKGERKKRCMKKTKLSDGRYVYKRIKRSKTEMHWKSRSSGM